MANTVSNHAVSAFTSPSNGDALNANIVKGNDNTLRAAYVDHDADPGIHLQSSLLADRPAAGTAGRKWMTTDSGAVRLWHDTGSVWEEVDYARSGDPATFSDLTVTGNTQLGDATTDTVAFTGRVASHVLPATTNAADLGSTAQRYRAVYAVTLDVSGSPVTLQGVPYTWPNAQGAASTYLSNDGAGNLSWSAGTTTQPLDQQTFNSSGTWTKPSQGSMALIECWGAGGSGSNDSTAAGRNAGAGGGYAFRLIRLSDLGATETVTVGAGGASRTTSANGIAGGNSTFGSFVTAYGGAGGLIAQGTSLGGSTVRSGQALAGSGVFGVLSSLVDYVDHFDRTFGGGCSYSNQTGPTAIKNSLWGGGAGAGADGGGTLIAAGTSVYGGNGGATATDGVAPGGGGGRGDNITGGRSGAGANGRVRVTVW